MKNILKKLEKNIGSMKTGLIFMGLLIILLVISSFLESYTSTAFADRLIYSSSMFMVLMGIICFIIVFSLLRRIPFRKKFFGFYIIHISLVMILIGGFLTSNVGLNGSIVLYPKQANNMVELNTHEVVLSRGDYSNNLTPFKSIELPYSAFATDINMSIHPDIRINKYVPFAGTKMGMGNPTGESIHYSVILDIDADGELIQLPLTNHPDSMYKSQGIAGNYNFSLLPDKMLNCFLKDSEYDFFFWDRIKQVCFMPLKKYFKVGMSKLGNRFIDFNDGKAKYKFWPEMSPRPMRGHGSLIEDATMMVLSKKIFLNHSNILLFTDNIYFWSVRDSKFVSLKITDDWMNIYSGKLRIRKVASSKNQPLIQIPFSIVPKAGIKTVAAINISNEDQNFWISMGRQSDFKIGEKWFAISLERKKIQLPFYITLKKFNMDHYPNSNMPATYQSFITMDKNKDQQMISMNNPLAYGGFRFFQSSYFELNDKEYASVLSVGRDAGRPLKYLGSILLLIGCIYYYSKRSRFS